ncbi:D-2-hydroxyacid dehydrogenase [Ferrimonas sediminicola]|uniref:D-2-hydroxyacid dehydrogenase n=1 Tax=Ferrimonas sediminicola TaxID=2569538 RepID=A0A4U1BML3_9GAMM|nr:D-2-hydroxyacid dehydrogenase [Ferrimonas sediminicola]TKB51368.1 D-2-hydroxyacid dehydrogenase [Ferrimonas sediminicola]
MTTLTLLTSNNLAYRALMVTTRPEGLTLVEDPAEAEIWLADPALAVDALRHCPPPSWLASTFAGVNPLLAPDLPRDYTLTHIKGIFGPLMAEYVMAHLLSLFRDLPRLRRQQQQKIWQPFDYDSVKGKTVLVLGTGDIGQEVARVAAAFGMTVIGVSRSGAKVHHFERVHPVAQLQRALDQAQVVVGVLPDTPATRGLLDAAALAALPEGAVLINIGRGSLVEEAALLDALESGPLSHAVLDVFPGEPLPAEHPYWHHHAITLTPHVAAKSFPEQIWQQFTANLERYQRGERLIHLFDWPRGY